MSTTLTSSPRASNFCGSFRNASRADERSARSVKRRGYSSLFDNEQRLEWSAAPGFYEKQLQIRNNNVYFPPQKQCVSRHDLYIARRMDAEERSEFLEQWKQCLENVMQSADVAPASGVANHLHAMYTLLENAASIGAEESEPAKQIRSAYETVLAEIFQALKDNPEATKALQTAEETRWSGSAFTLNPRIKQLTRISDKADVIPTMLSQNLETVRVMAETLDAERLAAVQATVRAMIEVTTFGSVFEHGLHEYRLAKRNLATEMLDSGQHEIRLF